MQHHLLSTKRAKISGKGWIDEPARGIDEANGWRRGQPEK